METECGGGRIGAGARSQDDLDFRVKLRCEAIDPAHNVEAPVATRLVEAVQSDKERSGTPGRSDRRPQQMPIIRRRVATNP